MSSRRPIGSISLFFISLRSPFHLLARHTRQKIDDCSQCEQNLSARPLHSTEFHIARIGGKVQIEHGDFLSGQLPPSKVSRGYLQKAYSSSQLACYWRKTLSRLWYSTTQPRIPANGHTWDHRIQRPRDRWSQQREKPSILRQ